MPNYERVCLCLVLRCRDCGWEGDQDRWTNVHYALNPSHIAIDVVNPACGETPCRTAVAIQEQTVTLPTTR